MTLKKDALIAISILIIVVLSYAVSIYNDYKLRAVINDWEKEQVNFKAFTDSLFTPSRKINKRSKYLSNLLINNKESIILHLDSIESNVIPDSFFSYESIRILKVISSEGGYRMKMIPHKIWRLKNLEILDLSGNEISEIPATISGLKNLKEINLKNHKLDKSAIELLRSRLYKKCNLILE